MRTSLRSLALLLTLSILLAGEVLLAQEHATAKVRQVPDNLMAEEATAANVYQEALPAVVTIAARYASQEEGNPEGSLGTGVLISPDCHVLTAAHVVDGAQEILVKTQDGVARPAVHIFSEAGADIALLRLVDPDLNLAHAKLGDSDRLSVGQWAYAIGTPFGLENSFSAGRISGFREFDRLYDGTILAEFIQTDAALNSGSSGGPVFNSSGEVIGIASRIFSLSGGSEGIGFAVAINTAKQLLALEDRIWMGFDAVFLESDTLGALFNLDIEGGMLVQQVVKGSPADKAGLRGGTVKADIEGQEVLLGGDLIVAMGPQESCHHECLVRARQSLAGSDEIKVSFLRGGREMEALVDVSASRRNFLEP